MAATRGTLPTVVRRTLVAMIVALGIARLAIAFAEPANTVTPGACYCRAEGQLRCVGETTRVDCDTRCAEALCDDWFWIERRPCWNWGYGG